MAGLKFGKGFGVVSSMDLTAEVINKYGKPRVITFLKSLMQSLKGPMKINPC